MTLGGIILLVPSPKALRTVEISLTPEETSWLRKVGIVDNELVITFELPKDSTAARLNQLIRYVLSHLKDGIEHRVVHDWAGGDEEAQDRVIVSFVFPQTPSTAYRSGS